MTKTSSFKHKSFRDPLHGFIGLSEKEVSLVDTKVFRRLHRIKQLSHTHLVYPSALHTRFEHSLGAAHIAGRMCDELCLESEKELVRQTALLHDIGHGPFSHLFENVLKKINPGINDMHEEITRMIIDNDQEIDDVLGSDKKKVVEMLSPKSKMGIKRSTLNSDIVSGNLDADKLDYLRRDSYFLGVNYGMFDLERIIHTLRRAGGDNPYLGIDIKGKDAVESYRLARHLMHAQVYEHHTRLAADQMFLRALDIAIHKEGVIDPDALSIKSSEFLNYYTKLDDNSVYELIVRSDKAKESKHILERIKQRKLLKRACQFSSADTNQDVKRRFFRAEIEELNEIAERVAEKLNIQSHEIIFHKSEIILKLYGEREFLLVTGNNEVRDLQDISPITAKKAIVTFYVFGSPKADLNKICSKVASELGVESKYICSFK